MTIGVPKEVKSQENRVGMIRASASELVKRGHRVVVETGADRDSSYLNAEHEAAGAEIVPPAVFQEAELSVKAKEPQPAELAMLEAKHTLFTHLHLTADKALSPADILELT